MADVWAVVAVGVLKRVGFFCTLYSMFARGGTLGIRRIARGVEVRIRGGDFRLGSRMGGQSCFLMLCGNQCLQHSVFAWMAKIPYPTSN